MINDVQTVAEKIKQRRSQMLVHSCIYYHLDDCLVSDHQWQQWANELRDLQNLFGWEIGYFDKEFEGWTGATGFDLPLRHPSVMSRAVKLLEHRDRLDAG